MPRRYGRYPSRDDFVQYLEAYVEHHQLNVRFNTDVLRVDRENSLWRLQTTTHPSFAHYVVIATGWDAVPVMPQWPGRDSFTPQLIHSSQFRGAMAYRGREVLVVGAGNSGIDIAGHLIAAGARVTVSMRTPPNLARREFLGLPGQPFLVAADHLPKRFADFSLAISQRLTFGDLTTYGLPRPAEGAYAKYDRGFGNPAVDDGFVAALKAGKSRVVGEVLRLEESDVILVDHERIHFDAVICATGYRRGLESLVGHLGALRPDGVPFAYNGAPEFVGAPQLYFAGMWGQFSGEIRIGPVHARRISRAAARHRADSRRRNRKQSPKRVARIENVERTLQPG
jgi:cation diffusion facilitator CzcD-associated flavoprotein CzcO